MHGWLQKLLKPRISLSTQQEHEAKVTRVSSLALSSFSSSSSSSSPGAVPSKPQQPQSALSSQQRYNLKYDLLVCHSSADNDIEVANHLVSFLEASPQSLRCFLWHRDVCPGGAFFTEFCQAVQDSHLQALLITPEFLQEDTCKYMLHQTLAEGPMSNRLIPLVHNLAHSQYPQELKFCIYINLSNNTNRGYNLINRTVLSYLEDLVKKEKTNNKDSCSKNSQKDGLMSNTNPAETSGPLEVLQKSNESLNDVCCGHH
ncbi:toll/interleukin-1 receptor domain-containing adapter protein [Mastacembelus armatus]|uniref:Toll-interleukin 1 receptor (TIR) domain containing adaptor protein n=1 Tax=Mastacembelus armatus TaxID=205130 RepID=A0A3Q3RFH5_9TELE|nr:toll/interleukin-1 receptor domain-containing adapter protein [Mastacembelus armatus]